MIVKEILDLKKESEINHPRRLRRSDSGAQVLRFIRRAGVPPLRRRRVPVQPDRRLRHRQFASRGKHRRENNSRRAFGRPHGCRTLWPITRPTNGLRCKVRRSAPRPEFMLTIPKSYLEAIFSRGIISPRVFWDPVRPIRANRSLRCF